MFSPIMGLSNGRHHPQIRIGEIAALSGSLLIMKIVSAAPSLIIVLSSLVGVVRAQQAPQPSLAETQDFLNEFTRNRFMRYSNGIIGGLTSVSTSHTCSAIKFDFQSDEPEKTELTFRPQEVEISVRIPSQTLSEVKFSCTLIDCIYVKYPIYEWGDFLEFKSARKREIDFSFSDNEEASRYIRGFKYLTELCGGPIKKLFEQ
jgi:hypothetical protein